MRTTTALREGWRNLISGTSRGLLLLITLTIVGAGAVVSDGLTVAGVVDRAEAFQASGGNVMIVAAHGAIEPSRCEALAAQPNVTAVGAIRSASPSFAVTLPQSSLPSFEVTPSFPELLGAAVTPGLSMSEEVADALGVTTGDTVRFLGGTETGGTELGDAMVQSGEVGGVFAYPADGRQRGLGFALLLPVSDRSPFDACWVEEWPLTDTTRTLLPGVVIAGGGDDTASPEFRQLNSTLGTSFDAASAFDERPTRFVAVIALALAFAAAFGLQRLRRLEIAMARHHGVRRGDGAFIALIETAPVALAAALSGLVAAAAVSTLGPPGDAGSTLLLASASLIAIVVGSCAGAVAGTLSVRSGQVLRYFKER